HAKNAVERRPAQKRHGHKNRRSKSGVAVNPATGNGAETVGEHAHGELPLVIIMGVDNPAGSFKSAPDDAAATLMIRGF
ncbi:hypothetical protein, partial [Pseudomonas sp. HMWF021]|uniref:hypothetical protein n=1 Tax=Pseudomonas sp. HMWF021 TaxID=2056857 RepID=UPI001C4412EA